MCAYRSIRSHWNRDRPRYVYGATRSSVAEPMFRVWSKPLLDQKRDLDFRFSAQMSRSTSRGCYPPTPLICGRAVANLAPSTRGFFPSLSCRLCRPSDHSLFLHFRFRKFDQSQRSEVNFVGRWGIALLIGDMQCLELGGVSSKSGSSL
jgi:hypothetical protein